MVEALRLRTQTCLVQVNRRTQAGSCTVRLVLGREKMSRSRTAAGPVTTTESFVQPERKKFAKQRLVRVSGPMPVLALLNKQGLVHNS